MSVSELQKFTFVSKYAQYNKEQKRRETWDEAVNRVRDMHIRKYPQLEDEIKEAFEYVRKKKVLPSQRSLQFGGKPIEDKNLRIYNCSAAYCDRIRFFAETAFCLLCGVGVGFSVQKCHVDLLPPVKPAILSSAGKRFQIPDTIEGWCEAFNELIKYYLDPSENVGRLDFDYSLIRPAGSSITSGTGKAPGPEPLRKALENVKNVFERIVSNNQEKLRPIDCYDIVMHIADAVLSGGVRRSATLCLFSPDDEEMLNAKTGDWFYKNPQRGRSNNSVLLIRNETTKEQFNHILESVQEFGEPGFVWADHRSSLYNPCMEISLYGYDTYDNSGFQLCNLTEINGRKISSIDDFIKAAKVAAFIGTLQAGYTDFGYLGKVSEDITKREALLGVSITGIMDSSDILLNTANQRKSAEVVKKENERVAKIIGINPSARCCTVKPSGTASLLLGSSNGIHPHHAKRYIRRVQCNIMEAPYRHFKSINIQACEKSVWDTQGKDETALFAIEVPDGSKTKNEMPALELLRNVKNTCKNWINTGRNEDLCVQPWLNHSVSNTVTVKDDEWEDVGDYIYNNRKYFVGVSLLPYSGDKDYPQAPYTTVIMPTEIVKTYGDASIFASGLIERALEAFDGNLWVACDIALGIKSLDGENGKKQAWVIKAQQFAQKYFANDVRKMTYLLKDVYNWKLYLDLTKSYKEVDYISMVEETDNTRHLEDNLACANGSCEI